MDEFILFIDQILIFVAWSLLFIHPLLQGLHMFQQNRYEVRRYWPWLINDLKAKSSHPKLWGIPLLAYGLLSLLSLKSSTIGASLGVGLTFGMSVILAYQAKAKIYIKPLVYTARVKRQIVVMVFLIGTLMTSVHTLSWPWILVLTPIIWQVIWILVVPMALVTLPFETLMKYHYVDLAKKILKQHPRLIKIGITGSYGKTSSKNILDEILSEKYYVLASPASFNTPMGLTITIREQLKALHQVFIAEMGADKVGEIEFLSRFIQPKIGIVTSIGPQHLNTFKSLDNIIQEKMRLIENLPKDGIAILNLDNPYLKAYPIKNTCLKVSYAIDSEADYQATDIVYSPQGSQFNVKYQKEVYPFKTRLLGKHNIANILAGIAVGRNLDLSWSSLQHAVSQVNYVEHRLQLKKINGYNYIDNAFNSNPEGSKMSLEVLKMMPGHRTLVTPGMIDLGSSQDAYNKAFGATMLGCADTVILVGKTQTKAIYEGLSESGYDLKQVQVVDTVKEAFKYIESHTKQSDIALLENDLPDAFNR